MAVLRSSRRSLEYADPGVALQPEGEAVSIFGVFQHGYHLLAELAGRHRRAKAGQKRFGLYTHGLRIGGGAGVADPGAADDLLRHDRLEAGSRFFCAETPPAYLAMNHSMRLAPP